MTTLPAPPMTTRPTNTSVAEGLRLLAQMIEDNPDLPEITYPRMDVWHAWSAEQVRQLGRAALHAGASVSKDYLDAGIMVMELRFAGLRAQVLAPRDTVSERIVVGEREVIEVVPDPEALAQVPTVELLRTEEIVEWRCAPGVGGE
jgi:hypothetical protein